MKLPRFSYACPATLDEALALLSTHPGEAMPIAGGQSLVPLLAFRLAAPSLLVDLRRVAGLDHITVGEGCVTLGAKVRWCDIEESQALRAAHPLLVAAIEHVAHYQVRNRGTVGGSCALADPSAEMPGIAVTCEAMIVIASPSCLRTVAAADFFLAPLTTALVPGELIVAIKLPPWQPKRRWGFEEFARRRGDFAMAGIALFYDQDEKGRAIDAHVGVIGACSRPHRLAAAEAALNGQNVDEATIEAVSKAAAEEVEPPEDFHATAAYRRALVAAMVERALKHSIPELPLKAEAC